MDHQVRPALVGARAAWPEADVASPLQVVRLVVVTHSTLPLEHALAVGVCAADARGAQAVHELVLLEVRLKLEHPRTLVTLEWPDFHLTMLVQSLQF